MAFDGLSTQYNFAGDKIVFNILMFDKENSAGHLFVPAKIYPNFTEDFKAVLKSAGFAHSKLYGNFSFLPFNSRTSKSLIFSAGK